MAVGGADHTHYTLQPHVIETPSDLTAAGMPRGQSTRTVYLLLLSLVGLSVAAVEPDLLL